MNLEGRRFVSEFAGRIPDLSGLVPVVMRQPQGVYWSVFDAKGRAAFFVSGSGWDDTNSVQREIFANPKMSAWIKRADSIEGLAQATGLPAATLEKSVGHWNEMIAAGEDTEWQRFYSGVRHLPRLGKGVNAIT